MVHETDSMPWGDDIEEVLSLVLDVAVDYLQTLGTSGVRDTTSCFDPPVDQLLPEIGVGASQAARALVEEARLTALRSSGPRFFNWATGGVTPAALAGDWLTSLFDQNARFWESSPFGVNLELTSIIWLKQLFGLPSAWGGTLTSGATMANFVALLAARRWAGLCNGANVEETGLYGLPPVRLFASEYVHPTFLKVVSMLGLGRISMIRVASARDGGFDLPRLARVLREGQGSGCIVIATAGDVNGGRFDPIGKLAELCERYDAWLHVDGAFGLFAGLSQRTAHLVDGIDAASSVVSDGHKWLNVPYDSGFVFLRDPNLLDEVLDSPSGFLGPSGLTLSARSPENSRRARGVVIWATLKAYGRSGYVDMVERHLALAQRLTAQILASRDFELLLPTLLNVVLFRYRPSWYPIDGLDLLNEQLSERLIADGFLYPGSLTRISGVLGFRPIIMNWCTSEVVVDSILSEMRAAAQSILR